PPPVAAGVELFPQQPDLARAFREQVLAREAHRDGETLSAFADQHDVAGVFHDRLRNFGDVANVAYGPDRAAAASGPMHATCIEFDHALLVRHAAQPNAVYAGVAFGSAHDQDRSVERVAAVDDVVIGPIEIRQPDVCRNEDGA